MDHRPWLGLASFTEANAAQFFGREAEVAELVRRLSRKGLTVLFGQSGLGKTSMLQAGVVPRLREAGFAPVLLRMDYSAESPSCEAQMLAALGWRNDEGLWEQLHRRDREGPAPLLIFDQFEEVFTLGQADEAGRAKAADFLTQLADLVENRVPAALEARLEDDDSLFDRYDLQRADFRLLISLREDYLAHLEPLKSAMPGITQNRMRIAPMTGEQALLAVCGPGGELVSTDTAEAIVCFVSGAKSIPHAEVEPALLSLILRELNEQRIAKGQAQITPDLLEGSHAAILSDFYERSLQDQPTGVRHFIEDQLLTDTGYRENVAEQRVKQAFTTAGARADALEQLVNSRLLRVEERLDRRRVELTHDTLCTVVAASRDNRRERQQLEAAQADAQAKAEQARVARLSLRKARLLSAGALGLATFAVAAGAWAWHTRQAAEAARNQAQSLLGFLLDDFYEDLQPVGRTPLVSALGQRMVGYYDALPGSLQGASTEAQRAQAELRTAMSLITQVELDKADPLLAQARTRFEALRAAGDRSSATQLGLAQAMAFQARVLVNRFKLKPALELAREAVALLPTQTGDIGPAERLAHYRVLMQLNWAADQERASDEGTRAGMRAVAVLREGGGDRPPKVDDPWSARLGMAFVDAVFWSVYTEGDGSPRAQAAEGLVQEALAQAERLLTLDPSNWPVRGIRAQLWRFLADQRRAAMDFAEARRLTALAIQERETLVRQDPRQSRHGVNLSIAYAALAEMNRDEGKLADAQVLWPKAITQVQRLPATGFNLRALNNHLRSYLALLLDLGELQEAQKIVDLQRQVHQQRIQNDAARAFLVPWAACIDAYWELAMARAQGAPLQGPMAALQAKLVPMDVDKLTGRDRSGAVECQGRSLEMFSALHLERQEWTAAISLLKKVIGLEGSPRATYQRRQRLMLALALHRAGRDDEARQALAPVLEWLAATRKPGHADQTLRLFDLAARQLEAELAPPAQAAALRAAVRAELKLLAPAMHRLASTRDWLRWFNLA